MPPLGARLPPRSSLVVVSDAFPQLTPVPRHILMVDGILGGRKMELSVSVRILRELHLCGSVEILFFRQLLV